MRTLAVIPIVVGPLQVLLAMLPAILIAVGSALLALLKPRTIKLLLKLLWRVKGSVLVAAALVAGTVYGARVMWPRGGRVGAAEAGAGDWPMFRGHLTRDGAASGTASPVAGGVNWAFTSDSKTIYSSPAVVGNRIYLTTAEVGVFANRGAIYCLDADTGGVVWKSAPAGYRATFSSPSVAGKYLVVGEGLHYVKDARVVCLDIEQNGKVLWTHRTASHVESSPAISDGRVFIGAGDDGYWCLRLEPDEKGNPVVLWHLEGQRYLDAETSPVVHEGKVYFGLGWGGQALVCADAATGEELWRVGTRAPVFTAPTIARGKVFVGMGFGDFVNAEEQAIANRLARLKADGKSAAEIEAARQQMKITGEVVAVDLATHQVAWTFTTDRSVLGCVVAGPDRVYCATRGGTVYALSYDGRELAKWNARAPIIASPALTDQYLYVVSFVGRLFALDKTSLQPVWETSLGSGDGHVSSPIVARGKVYAGTMERGLVCAGEPAGTSGPVLLTGDSDGSPLPERGSFIWRWPKDEKENAAAPLVTGLWAGGKSLAVRLVGPARTGIVSLPIDASARSTPVETAFVETPRVPQGVLSTTGEPVFSPVEDVHAVEIGPFRVRASTELVCADRLTDKPLWSVKLTGPATTKPVVHESVIYVATEENVEARRLADGARLWRTEGGLRQLVLADDMLVGISAAGEVRVLGRQDGVVRHQQAGAVPAIRPLVAGEVVLYATADALMTLRLSDGQTQRWMATGWLGNLTASPVLVDSSVYFATDKYGVVRAGRRQ